MGVPESASRNSLRRASTALAVLGFKVFDGLRFIEDYAVEWFFNKGFDIGAQRAVGG